MERSRLIINFDSSGDKLLSTENVVACGETFDILFRDVTLSGTVRVAFWDGDTLLWRAEGSASQGDGGSVLEGLVADTKELADVFRGGSGFFAARLTVGEQVGGDEWRDYGVAYVRLYSGIDPSENPPPARPDVYPTEDELNAWLEAAGTVREAVCTCAKAAASSAEAAASSARLASAQALDAVKAANAASASAKSAAQSAAQASADGVAAAKSAQAAQASESAAGQSAAQAAAQASGAARSAAEAKASGQAAASSATAASQSAAQAGRALADAQTARGDAQAARDAAKASEPAAAGSAKDAAASATQAAGSKAAAAGSASAAAASATQAQEAKSGAEAAKAGAETARDSAAKSATQAAQSADEAEAAKASLEEALAWSGKMRFRESCLRSLGYANGVAAIQERDAKSDRDQQVLHGDGQNYLFQGSGKFYLLDKDLKLVKDLAGCKTPFYSHQSMSYFPYFVVRNGRLIEQSWTGDTIYVYDVETKAQIARLSTGYRSMCSFIYNDRTGHLLVHKPSAEAGTVVTAMDIRDADLNIIGEMEAPEAIAPLCDKNGWPQHFAQHINGRTYVGFKTRATVPGTPLYILDENDVPQPVVDADGETVMMNADRTINSTNGYLGCWYPGFYTDNSTFFGADGTRKTRWVMTDGVLTWLGDAEDEHGEMVWTKRDNLKACIDALGKRNIRPNLCSGSGGHFWNSVSVSENIVMRFGTDVYCCVSIYRKLYIKINIGNANGGGTVPVPGSNMTVINTSGYQTASPVLIYC